MQKIIPMGYKAVVQKNKCTWGTFWAETNEPNIEGTKLGCSRKPYNKFVLL